MAEDDPQILDALRTSEASSSTQPEQSDSQLPEISGGDSQVSEVFQGDKSTDIVESVTPVAALLLSDEVTITVESKEGMRYHVKSPTSQLERIGALLRGNRKGWDPRTVLLSVTTGIVTGATTIYLSSAFNHSSWVNSLASEEAKGRVTKAYDAYDKAINAIGERFTATREFVPTLRDLINNRTETTGILAERNAELLRTRTTNYYEKLKQWNVGYNSLLTRIDYDLDRQAYTLAGTNVGNPVATVKTETVDCKQPIIEQMKIAGYEHHSSKAQFAIINYCFILISATIDNLKTKALSDSAFKVNAEDITALNGALSKVNTMTNTFQCFAKQREEFYISQVRASLTSSVGLLWLALLRYLKGEEYVEDLVNGERRPAVLKHFEHAERRCNP